jgi:hypothetical protein
VFYASTSELATLNNTFSVDGVATDPATVTLTVTPPSGTATAYTYAASQITRTATGKYRKDISCDEPGEWSYEWVGTGAASDVVAGTWTVYPIGLGKLYATVEALKSRVGITDSVDDYELHGACLAASRTIEQFCSRVFWRSPSGTTRTLAAGSDGWIDLGPFNDLVSVSAIATDTAGTGTFGQAWTTGDYQLMPVSPSSAPEPRPYTALRAVGSLRFPLSWGDPYLRAERVQITGVWGWPAVPHAIREATLILAAELFRMKDAPLGVVGMADFGVVRVRAHPTVARLAGPYQLMPVLVG